MHYRSRDSKIGIPHSKQLGYRPWKRVFQNIRFHSRRSRNTSCCLPRKNLVAQKMSLGLQSSLSIRNFGRVLVEGTFPKGTNKQLQTFYNTQFSCQTTVKRSFFRCQRSARSYLT